MLILSLPSASKNIVKKYILRKWMSEWKQDILPRVCEI